MPVRQRAAGQYFRDEINGQLPQVEVKEEIGATNVLQTFGNQRLKYENTGYVMESIKKDVECSLKLDDQFIVAEFGDIIVC